MWKGCSIGLQKVCWFCNDLKTPSGMIGIASEVPVMDFQRTFTRA